MSNSKIMQWYWVLVLGWFSQIQVLAEEVPGILYEVEFSGVENKNLRTLLKEASRSRANRAKRPASLSILHRRASKDRARLLKVLRSEGYYQGTVDSKLHTNAQPVRLEFHSKPGPRYQWGKLQVKVTPSQSDFPPITSKQLGIIEGQPVLARELKTAQKNLLKVAQSAGYALAKHGKYRALIDHESKTVRLLLEFHSGSPASLDVPTFAGIDKVDMRYLHARVPWQAGQPYRPELLQKLRQSLLATNLFTTVRIRLGEALTSSGLLPVHVNIKERPHRTIAVGARFRTDEGPGLSFRWQHRNYFGHGEQLSLNSTISGVGLRLASDFRKPDFARIGQNLIADALLQEEQTDAFDSFSLNTSIGLERSVGLQSKLAMGVAFRLLELTQDGETESFGLFYLPTKFSVDSSDHPLDPTRGGRLALEGAPFLDTLGSGVVFTKLLVRYSHYLQITKQPRLILATRITTGTLLGADLDSVPADERFYAGGGGSLRGFGFQLASPLDEEDDPLGGRSLLEVAAEIRLRVTSNIGVVTFLDAGRAFESSVPDFGQKLFLGAGIGLRYHTPIGPVRFDLGFPINGRDSVDDTFQIYLSIGQAF